MTYLNNETVDFKNAEYPFTELFSLLKRHEFLPDELLKLAYETKELKVMHKHVENAVDILLQGLQNLGHLISLTVENKRKVVKEVNDIGFFISTISNLTEALNTLRADTSYELRKRGEVDY